MTAPTAAKPVSLNRLVAFAGPYLAIGSGALAAWLAHHLPGLQLQQTGTAATISTAAEFLGGVLVTWAMQHKWLDGWQKWEQAAAGLAGATGTAGVAGAAGVADPIVPAQLRPGGQPLPVPVPTAAELAADLATAVTEAVLPRATSRLPAMQPAMLATQPVQPVTLAPQPAIVDGIVLLPPAS